jgi:hypothetical protein
MQQNFLELSTPALPFPQTVRNVEGMIRDVVKIMMPTVSTNSLPDWTRLPFANLRSVLDAGCSADQVGIITPYMAQVHGLG